MTVDPLTVLREALDSCDSLCARAPLCADFAAARAALAAVEQLVEAARAIVLDPEFPGRGPMQITRGQKECLAAALARFEGDSQPEGER